MNNFLNNLLLLLNGCILKNIVPKFINNVYKFSDELLSIYKFWENFGKIYTIKFSIKKYILLNFEKKIFNKKLYKNILNDFILFFISISGIEKFRAIK